MAHIMIVTDNDMLRRYLGEKLKRAGHVVTRVSDYDVALTILFESYHDILLTSVSSQNNEGLLFSHEARRLDPEMRVLFMTGFSVVPLICDAVDDEGFGDRLGKPAHLNQLVPEVSRLLAA